MCLWQFQWIALKPMLMKDKTPYCLAMKALLPPSATSVKGYVDNDSSLPSYSSDPRSMKYACNSLSQFFTLIYLPTSTKGSFLLLSRARKNQNHSIKSFFSLRDEFQTLLGAQHLNSYTTFWKQKSHFNFYQKNKLNLAHDLSWNPGTLFEIQIRKTIFRICLHQHLGINFGNSTVTFFRTLARRFQITHISMQNRVVLLHLWPTVFFAMNGVVVIV